MQIRPSLLKALTPPSALTEMETSLALGAVDKPTGLIAPAPSSLWVKVFLERHATRTTIIRPRRFTSKKQV